MSGSTELPAVHDEHGAELAFLLRVLLAVQAHRRQAGRAAQQCIALPTAPQLFRPHLVLNAHW